MLQLARRPDEARPAAASRPACMHNTRHFLQSAKYPNVTTIQTGEDCFDRSPRVACCVWHGWLRLAGVRPNNEGVPEHRDGKPANRYVLPLAGTAIAALLDTARGHGGRQTPAETRRLQKPN